MILRGITHDYLFISRFYGALKIFLELRGQHAMGGGGWGLSYKVLVLV